ncbi:EAL domain-containing protein [Photobacterium leiognathi]|uniref:EAL domain-containing protein n=1 Tax=Photobacterium leiognathi TaxID=553611 RepID=UPI002735B396|nr:EAL domain-containing protein [Photobacterium leiognathi]
MINVTTRWKKSGFYFVISLFIIYLLSNLIAFQIFKYNAIERIATFQHLNHGRYDKISKDIEHLVSRLSLTCDKRDINIIRDFASTSNNIRIIQLITNHKLCSIYGKKPAVTDYYSKKKAIQSGKLSIHNYTNNRLIFNYQINPTSKISVVSESIDPFYINHMISNENISIFIECNNQKLKLSHNSGYISKLYSFKYKLDNGYTLVISINEKGINNIKKEYLYIFILLGIICFLLCLAFALNHDKNKSIQQLIQQGLNKGEFIPYYQPIINSKTQQLVGCEVLVRWKRCNGEIFPPYLFIRNVENCHLIYPMTKSILQQVLTDFTQVQVDDNFCASINVTPQQLENPQFMAECINIIESQKTHCPNIALEVTERMKFTDIDKAKSVMTHLSDYGIKLKLDDAGTGFGGFSYLQTLPLDTIKIDKMFIDTIGTNDMKRDILKAIINFGHETNLEMIAEGVETQQQVDYLAKKNVHIIQGYLYAKPMPFCKFKQYIKQFSHN